jgi:hypothetical protein
MLNKNLFYKRIRQFATETPSWATAIRYHTKPDERFDLTLVARRVYGLLDEWYVIMAAAGLQSVDEPLNEQLLVLPTLAQLQTLKRELGVI